MNNVSKDIRQAYYDALDGNISVGVYKDDVPEGVQTHHVVIRVESEVYKQTSSGFLTKPVVITEVVGVFSDNVDPDVVEDIDNEVRQIILPDVGARAITVNGIQISNIMAVDSHYVNEYDGAKRYYSKITRWQQRVSHT